MKSKQPKQCVVCGGEFVPLRPTKQVACSQTCSRQYRREACRAYYHANPEKQRERKRAYNQDNFDKRKAYRHANPEKYKQADIAYYHANPEKCREAARKRNVVYYRRNPEKYRQKSQEYRQTNPAKLKRLVERMKRNIQAIDSFCNRA